jgi:urease accessory protein
MKLALNTDFTRLPRASQIARRDEAARFAAPFASVVLEHDERHLRRKVLELAEGGKLLVDLPEPVVLEHGDRLVLDDGRSVEIIAAQEDLYDVRVGERVPLRHLAWHLGNRHLAAQIDEHRILIRRDHVIRDMLIGLGATVGDTVEPFQPVHGAYHSHGGHGHDGHDHGHSHAHDHSHTDRDKFGRLPGDPHYGHNHA